MRAMKDSGVEWIGQIPQEWDVSRTKYVYQIISGNGFKDHLQGSSEGDYPFYKVSDINGSGMNVSQAANYVSKEVVQEYRFSVVPRGALIIAKIGEALKKNHRKITGVDCVVDNNLQALIPVSNINDKYFFYQFLCVDMAWFDNGGTIPSVNNQKLLDFMLVAPPVAIQERIVSFLDAKCAEIDALIAAKEKTNALLKERRQSIIYEAVTKGLNPNVPMKDSGIEWIGQIPEDWDIRKIKYCFDVYAGATPKSGNSELWDGDIIWVTPADYTTEQKYISKGRKNITQEGFESCSTEMIPAGSLIFSKRAPIGLVAINTVELCTNQGCLSCVSTGNNDVEYFYYAFSCFTEQFDLYGSGTTFKEISADAFVNFDIPYPVPEEQRQISKYLRDKCTEMDALISANEETIQKLKEYRQSIIYEAVTGKVEV